MNVILTMKAKYFGIEVDLLCQLNQCSLVRFKDRSFVVDTADLVLERNFKQTARAAKVPGLLEASDVLARKRNISPTKPISRGLQSPRKRSK